MGSGRSKKGSADTLKKGFKGQMGVGMSCILYCVTLQSEIVPAKGTK